MVQGLGGNLLRGWPGKPRPPQMTRRLLPAALLVLAGCEPSVTAYPSLAPRAVEKQGFAEPVVPDAEVAADPALDAQLASLRMRLDGIASGFTAAAVVADRRAVAARGRPAGSEPWLDAQTALATLDDWRAQASALATDVEELAINRAATLAPPYPALGVLSERAAGEGERQGNTIARLQAMLAPA